MRLTETRGNYFYFSFDQSDFTENNMGKIHQFLNVLKKDFDHDERFWLDKMKCWAIKKTSRMKFDNLINRYFNKKQESIL